MLNIWNWVRVRIRVRVGVRDRFFENKSLASVEWEILAIRPGKQIQ